MESKDSEQQNRRWAPLIRRLLSATSVVAIAVVGWVVPAFAHAELQSTSPTDGAVLDQAPDVVAITFREPVEIPLGSVQVFDAVGRRVAVGVPHHPGGQVATVAANLPARLGHGGYVVSWRVISADSHPARGAFTFRIGSGTSTSSALGEAATLRRATADNRTVGVTYGVLRAVVFGAVALLLGGTALAAASFSSATVPRRIRTALWAGWLTSGLSCLVVIGVQGAYGDGRSLSAIADPSVITAVLHTRFGQLVLLRLVLIVLVAGPLLVRAFPSPPRPTTTGPWWSLLTGGSALAILLTFSLAGHAGSGSQVGLAAAFDLIHMGAAVVWIGGLAVLALSLGRSSDRRSAVASRFSRWALVSVMALAVTGGMAAWREVGTVSAITTTTYGRLLLAKTAGFAVLVGLGALNRHSIQGHGERRLSPVVQAELVVAAVVLSLTAVLINAQPAKQAFIPSYRATVAAGPAVRITAVIKPTRAGPAALDVYTSTKDGTRLPVPEIIAKLSLQGTGLPISVSELRANMQPAGPGHMVSSGLDVPIAGQWKLDIAVRVDEINKYYADPIVVRFR